MRTSSAHDEEWKRVNVSQTLKLNKSIYKYIKFSGILSVFKYSMIKIIAVLNDETTQEIYKLEKDLGSQSSSFNFEDIKKAS